AAIIRGVVAGEHGPARDIVVLNAAAVLFLAGRAAHVREGIRVAADAIDAGAAATALDALVRLSARAADAGATEATT
ncbi:MAG: hypothetical protein NTY02_20105, partial [Acidobacteria bacterium]|nr:hypothetical protein [Acidobacteriota bacterium]